MNYLNTSIAEKVRKARRVYIVGNGGSFSNAQHIQNDLESVGIRAHTINPASLTRIANDNDYEFIFADWLAVHGEKGDLLIALSGSGTSPNILRALQSAKVIGMDAVLFTDNLTHWTMQQSEEEQVKMGHDVMRAIRDAG